MSNPLINRWGLNLVWYKLWYIDKYQFLFFNQDNLIERLVYLYLHYGILCQKNLFFNKYWYLKINLNLINISNLKYYRVVEYKNKLLNKSYFYNIRVQIKNIYITKLWLLRYQTWLVLNFYCFQIIKKKYNTRNIFKKNKNLFFFKNSFNLNSIKRMKFFLMFLLTSYLIKKNFFSF